MNAEERNKFLYETKPLLPCKRKEMFIEFIDKAKSLDGARNIRQALYSQMDYKTMDLYEKN